MFSIHTLVLIGHVLVSAAIIGLVLIQRGKGAEAGAAFGAGASGTVFGAKGSANFLSRSTAVMATLFFLTSLGLAYLGSQRPVGRSLLEQTTPAEQTQLQSPPAAQQPDATPTPELPAPEQVPATEGSVQNPGAGD